MDLVQGNDYTALRMAAEGGVEGAEFLLWFPAEPAVGYSSLLLQSAFLSQVPDSISHALEVQLGEIKSNLLWS